MQARRSGSSWSCTGGVLSLYISDDIHDRRSRYEKRVWKYCLGEMRPMSLRCKCGDYHGSHDYAVLWGAWAERRW